MDKYVIRESRLGGEYVPPTPMQNMQFRMNPDNNNNMMNPELYENYRAFGPGYPNPMYRGDSGFMNMPPGTGMSMPNNMIPVQNQSRMSGIDPRYLATFADNNAAFISGQHSMQREIMANNVVFAEEYQNRNTVGPNRNTTKTFLQSPIASEAAPKTRLEFTRTNSKPEVLHDLQGNKNQVSERIMPEAKGTAPPSKVASEVEALKNCHPVMSRADKIKAIHKNGPRAFSGPVEKVLKWHKALQDFGILVLYEIVGKCVNIRTGEMSAKNLVVRDENGPAMQVVYYEIDFLLPELKPPCTVRVIGRMMPGTCRLQAFSVRLATGDDVATLARRAAVAAHHVAKICKECNEINH